MREIILDTETTGFDPDFGDRVVEIAAVELFDHIPTGRIFHQYINPEMSMPQAAYDVHGLGDDFLSSQPLFKDVAANLLDFIGSAKLVIHNASFDLKFLNAELGRLGRDLILDERTIDTLKIAREKFPGSPASLESLTRRFEIDIENYETAGALRDSEILAEIYYHLGDFRKKREALADQVSLILRNSIVVSMSAKDTARNIRISIEKHLNDFRTNNLPKNLQIFEDLAAYFDKLSVDLSNSQSKNELEDRVKKLESLVLDLTNKLNSEQTFSARKVFMESFVETCGNTAAVALISGGTLILGRYAPYAIDAMIEIISLR